MKEITIDIAKEFSRFPFGRFTNQSDTSGEKFRNDILVPALNEYDVVTIVLDGAKGYGSSFLEEAFGGLMRVSNLKYAEVRKKLKIKSTIDPSLPAEIDGYMMEAEKQKKQ